MPQYGGNPHVVTAQPEIHEFEVGPTTDWIVMGSDGIYDYLTNEMIGQICQQEISHTLQNGNTKEAPPST
jgi:protein phosphatase 2C family protein 2/3